MKDKHDLEDMVCLASLQKCFAAATTELCLMWCARNSSFVVIPQGRHRERCLSTTCYRPTNKVSSCKIVLWLRIFILTCYKTAKPSIFSYVWFPELIITRGLLKEHESVVSLEGTRYTQSRNEGKLF